MVEYTQQPAQALFKRFADDDDPEVIGPGGVENLCKEAGIPLEGAQPLILAWQFGAQEMAKFSRPEWLRGTDDLRCAHKLVVLAGLTYHVHKNRIVTSLGSSIKGAG